MDADWDSDDEEVEAKRPRESCAGFCSYNRHRNPPAHFSEVDRPYCCRVCRETRGGRHGGHCERAPREGVAAGAVGVEEEEPFVELFAASSMSWRRLQTAKRALQAAPESTWRARDLPSANFTDQFKGCLRELDDATGGRLTRGGADVSSGGDGRGAAIGGVGSCMGCAVGGAGSKSPLTFLDLGCAPGGFSLYLLERGLKGVGVTLAPQPGFHGMDRRLDNQHDPIQPVALPSGEQKGWRGFPAARRGGSAHGGEGASEFRAWTLHYADLTDAPDTTVFEAPLSRGRVINGEAGGKGGGGGGGEEEGSPRGPSADLGDCLFDVVVAGARFSKSGKSSREEEGGRGTRAVAGLLTSQLLLALRHLRPGGNLVLVLNVTPLLTYCAPLALLREYFGELVACKPASTFEHRSSCYVAALGYAPSAGGVRAAQHHEAAEETAEETASEAASEPSPGDDVVDPWGAEALAGATYEGPDEEVGQGQGQRQGQGQGQEQGPGGPSSRGHPVTRLLETLRSLREEEPAETAGGAAEADTAAEASAAGAPEASSVGDRRLHFPCAPLVDVTPKQMCEAHSGAVQELMEPLWDFQAACVEDLLGGDFRGHPGRGGGGGGSGSPYGKGRRGKGKGRGFQERGRRRDEPQGGDLKGAPNMMRGRGHRKLESRRPSDRPRERPSGPGAVADFLPAPRRAAALQGEVKPFEVKSFAEIMAEKRR